MKFFKKSSSSPKNDRIFLKMTKIFEKMTKIFENIIKFSKNDLFLKKKQKFFVKIEISVKFEIFREYLVMKMIFLKLLSC